jgi:ABC-2 type transport system ATP-binding protein
MEDMMQTAAVEVLGLTYRYRAGTDALHGVDLSIPQGALFALLGPNGAGKTTFVQILAGLRRATRGRASVLGIECSALAYGDRTSIAYVNENQQLPTWMRVEQLEAYVAPLYPTWDASLAAKLRDRFQLPTDRPIRTFSRGERMKAALLCVLAPRPKLLLMDEPFSGMDAIVKDELVRGLLESAGAEGWTVLLSSHDIGELELLADRVGILAEGRMRLNASMDDVRSRFKRVEVTASGPPPANGVDANWMSVERAGNRLGFVADTSDENALSGELSRRFPAARVEVRPATLREVFVAVASRGATPHAVRISA